MTRERHRLTPEQRDMLGRIWPVARSVARKYAAAYGEGIDFEGPVAERLAANVAGWDPGKKGPAGWAAAQANYACKDVIRETFPSRRRAKCRRGVRARSLNILLAGCHREWVGLGGDEKWFDASEVLGRPDPPAPLEAEDSFRVILEGLPPRDARILVEHFVVGRTMKDVGRDYGIGQSAVREIIRKGTAYIRRRPERATA